MKAQTFLDNFATIAGAPGGIQRLRDLVLGLGLSGQLTERAGTDGSVTTLLAAAKQELAEAHQRQEVQRPSELRPITNQPHAIPSSWAWMPLGHLVAVLDFRRRPIKGEDRLARVRNLEPSDLFPYYGATQQVGMIDDYLFDDQLVLLGEDGAPFLTEGKQVAYVVSGKCWVNNHAHVLRGVAVQQRYLAHALNRVDYADFVTGTTRLKLTQGKMIHLPIPVPPLAEQDRIVAKVDELVGLCDELEARQDQNQRATSRFRRSALSALEDAKTPEQLFQAWGRLSTNWGAVVDHGDTIDDLRQNILQQAVDGKLVAQSLNDPPAKTELQAARTAKASSTNGSRRQPPLPRQAELHESDLPNGWVWAQVDDAFLVTGGIQKSPKRQPHENHHPYLRVANVQRGRLDLREIERFELFEGELDRLRLAPGDLLVIEGNGSETEIGRCARWDGQIEDCVHQNHIIRCRPMLPGLEHYLLLFLNSPAGRSTMKDLAVTTSGLYNLSVAKIRAIRFPMPPAAEQARIRQKVDELMGLCGVLESQLLLRQTIGTHLAESAVAAIAR